MSVPKILFIAPYRDFSGYACVSRNYIAALDSVGLNLVLRQLNYDGGKYNVSERFNDLEKRNIQNIDIVFQMSTPNETERLDGVFNINCFCWETDRVPPEWVNQLNNMNLAIVPCDANFIAARKSGVVIPIEKVHFAFDPQKYRKRISPYYSPGTEDSFKMLSISQISKKKGMDVLIKAYCSEFVPQDNALLILKVYYSPSDTEEHRQMTINQVQKIKELMRLGEYPRILIIHELMEPDAVDKLYFSSDAYILPSRGEGWSVTHFDAMGYGVPPIAVNWGGPTEFITKKEGWLVDCHMSPVFDMRHPHNFMYTSKDNWAEPHIDDLRRAMRQAFHEWKVHRVKPINSLWSNRIENCKKRVSDFSYEIVGPQLKKAIMEHYERWKNVN